MRYLNIEEINESNIGDVNKCNGEFTIDSRLVVHLENDVLHYEIVPLPISKKRYAVDKNDYTPYIDNVDKVVFLAYANQQIAGQVILRKNWNNYAYVEDIVVDARFRRQGIGRELISQAQRWARQCNLMGIMLETQNNNVRACKFYESCGFQLKGFDSDLYKGINRATDEVALYWYLVFSEDLSG